MNRTQIIQQFLNGATSGKASSLSISGDRLFSYATCIAERVGSKLVVNTTKYSQSTSVQQNALLRAAKSSFYEVQTTEGEHVKIGTKRLVGAL